MIDVIVAKDIVKNFSWPAKMPKPRVIAMRHQGPLNYHVSIGAGASSANVTGPSPERALYDAVVMWIKHHNAQLPAEALAMKLHLAN